MTPIKTFPKDPDVTLDYKIDWSLWLTEAGSDTISASSWASNSTDITIDSDTNTTTDATVWLSGGVAGYSYLLTNSITTAAGRTAERTIEIECYNR
jgi:hypothetical protein